MIEFHEALESVETEEEYEEVDQARISINAFAGIIDYTTMKVRGFMERRHCMHFGNMCCFVL